MSHKIQINGKLQSGVITTLGGDTHAEFFNNLIEVGFTQDESEEILASYRSSFLPVFAAATANVVAGFSSAPAAPAGGGHSCRHGQRTYREGVSKAGKAYKVWSCSSGDRNDECSPEWVR